MKVVRIGGGAVGQGRDAAGLHRDDAVEILQDAIDHEEWLAEDFELVAVEDGGVTIAFMMPVSSSMLRKTKPLAVPGRWRTITLPAMRTMRPSGIRARCIAGTTPSAFISMRRHAIGMLAHG